MAPQHTQKQKKKTGSWRKNKDITINEVQDVSTKRNRGVSGEWGKQKDMWKKVKWDLARLKRYIKKLAKKNVIGERSLA